MTYSIESIKGRLKNIAKKENKTFHTILYRYFHERLLYRIAQSKYKNSFCLKGGALLYALEQETGRPTKDIDLLGQGIPNDVEELKKIFLDICQIGSNEDRITFDLEKIKTEEINEDNNYSGVRLKIITFLGKTQQLIQIDIGFGDAVTPASLEMTYPTLLDMEPPVIQVYSVETIIAEKFQAMIDLADRNSRMKDFYDVYKLLSGDYNIENLQEAIQNTFERRGTSYMENHSLFTEEFVKDEIRLDGWRNFLKKSNLDTSLDFENVLKIITTHLKPIYDALR